MKSTHFTGKRLREIGIPQGRAVGAALALIEKHLHEKSREEVAALIRKVAESPSDFLDDVVFSSLALELIPKPEMRNGVPIISLRETHPPFAIYGAEHIEPGALQQMETAMRLPVTVAGALMPDAHHGYGLPIGGVLAANNAVIPYGVGVDIGCRMCLSVFDIPEAHFEKHRSVYKRELIASTKFGAGNVWEKGMKAEHEILEDPAFHASPFLRHLHEKAADQLGTSGGGNHFVEWGIMEITGTDEQLNLPAGKYLALLSHSGSRGFGATIAGHYTQLAKSLTPLPDAARNLAWLDLDSEAGQEYWLSMNLAGEYASACHEVIHQRLTKAVGANLLSRVENHHNFAWKEIHDGREVIVHRKGATPAATGVLGIIPGSMTAPGYLVRGKGNDASLHSASHGAGRQMSRTQASNRISRHDMTAYLKDFGVTLIGAGTDEAPQAYKDIRKVMASQTELVDVLGTFTPKMVRMADDGSRED